MESASLVCGLEDTDEADSGVGGGAIPVISASEVGSVEGGRWCILLVETASLDCLYELNDGKAIVDLELGLVLLQTYDEAGFVAIGPELTLAAQLSEFDDGMVAEADWDRERLSF